MNRSKRTTTTSKQEVLTNPTSPIDPNEVGAIESTRTDLTRTDLTPIQLRGVRVHNLQNINVDIPRGKLVGVCGVSGSGKTSLALDTLYAEGQRRYIESFSAYTRQFLQRLDKPDYDSIDQLPPALAVTRRSAARGNRSTVGTASETLDYLRLLFAKIAELKCYGCGRAVVAHSASSVAKLIATLPKVRLQLCFGTSWTSIEERASVLADLQSSGFVRLIVGGPQSYQTVNLGTVERDQLVQALASVSQVWVVVDRLQGGEASARVNESLENAFEFGLDEVVLLMESSDETIRSSEFDDNRFVMVDEKKWFKADFSNQLKCSRCKIEFPSPEPRLFSFNSPLGACPTCEGFGDTIDLDFNLVVPDPRKTIRQGAIAPWNSPSYNHHLDELMDVADELEVPLDVPFSRLETNHVKQIIHGNRQAAYGGLVGFFAGLERKKYKMHVRVFLSRWRSYNTCAACGGKRLSPTALSYSWQGHNFADLCEIEIEQLAGMLEAIRESLVADKSALKEQVEALSADAKHRSYPISSLLKQTQDRLTFLQSVGLGYLTLGRTLRTLSSGEAQRTSLTTALGSSLVNMLYVLDEPSSGLHAHDVQKLSGAIQGLANRGNTVVMVEHEDTLLRQASHLIELGPQAGEAGGQIVFSGQPAEVKKAGKSLTIDYLNGWRTVPRPAERRPANHGFIRLTGCAGNNLRNLDVDFPLGVLCLITGVSGSGKSSLVQETLYGAVTSRLSGKATKSLPYTDCNGLGPIEECVLVDQDPVSRSPRSNPVTYVKAFDEIRQVFAETMDAKIRNFSPSHFSFNSDLGRCSTCNGDGVLQIEMQFLADIYMTCSACQGARYRSEILDAKYRDRSIADVLQMSVREAILFFRGADKVQQKLKVLSEVGLDYLQLGQSATTLSSGEAQRLKLAGHLAAASRKRTLFLMDEPTSGLHPHDVCKLLSCFDALIEAGHSLIVVEHNLHLIAAADFLIDVGPGPAQHGGQVVATGTPENVMAVAESKTGQYLKKFLSK